jgi:diguanylate cyclase (GGDEF)-like protein/PAS domain S-box-containing protein
MKPLSYGHTAASFGAQRLRVALVMVLAALAAVSWSFGLAAQPGVAVWEPALFAVTGGTLLVLMPAILSGAVRQQTAANLTVGLMTLLVCERLLMLKFGSAYDDPRTQVFLPAHATLPVLSLLCVVLLPHPRAIRVATGIWLVQALIVTATLVPFLAEPSPRPYLVGTLLFVWLMMAIFLALLMVWMSEQHDLSAPQAVTAAEAAQQDLSRSEARLRLIFEQGTTGIGLVDAEACWLEVNEQLARMLGYSRAELVGTPLCRLLPEAERSHRQASMLAFIGNPGAAVSELRDEAVWLHRDGHPVWLSRHIRRIDDGPGKPARAVVIAIDISDRVRAEARADERKRHQEFHFQNLPLALIEWDRDLRVRSWSQQAEALLGWTASEVVGRSLREAGVLVGEEADDHERVMAEFLSGRRTTVESLCQTCRRDGQLAWFRWYSRCLLDSEGRPEFFFTAGLDVSELMHNNLRLDNSRKELRAIFEQAGVGIAMLDGNGRWLTVNQRLCEIVGRNEAELLSSDFQSLTHPDDLEIDLVQARQVAAGEIDRYTMEKRYLAPDGQVIWARLHVGRIDATASTPMRFVSVVEDISAARAAEAEAAEHRRIREFHLENTPLATIEWSPDFRVRRWSKRATELYGWMAHEVLGLRGNDWPFVHGDDLPRVVADLTRMLDERSTYAEVANRNLHKDGRILWCQWHNSVLRDADGEVVSILSMVKDVSDAQFTLAALRDSQARFRSIFDQSAVGNVIIDADGNWLMVNRRFREIVGHDAESLHQHSCEEITDARDRAAEAALRAQLIAGEIPEYTLEKRYRRGDGKPVWVTIYARRLEGDSGVTDPVRLSLVVVDSSERRKAEAEIRKLNTDLEHRVAVRTGQLNDTVRSWALRTQELRLLGEMTALLTAARDLPESSRIIERYLPQVFTRCGGAVWLTEAEGSAGTGRMRLLSNWGRVSAAPPSLSQDDCWGMRRGQILRVEDPADPLMCPHLHGQHRPLEQRPHTCAPVLALGEAIGLIHLEWSEQLDAVDLPPDPVLVRNVAEQVGLAIGNVQLREELRQQAIRDPLTGLHNRRHFDELLRSRIADQARNGRGFALLMIDIDHFKRINDEHGHDIGDEVLRETGGLLLRTVRNDESVFRLGGEEFVMIVNDVAGSGEQVASCAERVRKAAEAMRILRQGRLLPPITVSIGLARYPQDALQGADLLKRADAALYTAKRSGRNRVCMAGGEPDPVSPPAA